MSQPERGRDPRDPGYLEPEILAALNGVVGGQEEGHRMTTAHGRDLRMVAGSRREPNPQRPRPGRVAAPARMLLGGGGLPIVTRAAAW